MDELRQLNRRRLCVLVGAECALALAGVLLGLGLLAFLIASAAGAPFSLWCARERQQ